VKTLLLMRHGKSSWSDPSLEDFDRPLKKRGIRAAGLVGAELRNRGMAPDLIWSSAARRALDTARLTAKAVGYAGEIRSDERLYFSGVEEQIGIIEELDDRYGVVMVFGHNPDMEALVAELTGEHVQMPTAALAQIEFAIDSWKDLRQLQGTLVSTILPRELEP
jgi:phosphohistidine phosphatase